MAGMFEHVSELEKYFNQELELDTEIKEEEETISLVAPLIFECQELKLVLTMDKTPDEFGYVMATFFAFPCQSRGRVELELYEAINSFNAASNYFKCYVDSERVVTLESSLTILPEELVDFAETRCEDFFDLMDEYIEPLLQIAQKSCDVL